jgi:hypothetical protein
VGEVGDGAVRPGRAELAAAMGSPSVVVRLVLGQDQLQVSLTEDQHPVCDLRPGGQYEPFGIGVRPGALGRDLHGLDTGAGQGRIERCGELPGPVADQEPEARGAITEIHREVADLLRGPGPVRVRGDPAEVHVAAAGLDHEQAIQPLERHCAVHVEEVRGKHRRGLGTQELLPGCIGVPLRRRGYLQRLEDPPDRGRADPVAELEQFALDPLVAPAVVLGGEPLDGRCDLGADRRPACPVRVGPLPGDQAAVPPQDGTGGDQPMRPQPSRREADQRGEHSAVGPVQAGPRIGAAQHGDLVPQHQQLRVLGGGRAAEQDQPAAQPGEDQIEQTEGHG